MALIEAFRKRKFVSYILALFQKIYINKPVSCQPVNLLLKLSKKLSRGLLAVTLGVILSPEPKVLTSLLESALGLPAQLGVSPSRVSSEVEHVTSTTRSNLVGLVLADGSGESTDHLVDCAALTGAQVPGAHTGVVGAQVVQSLEVAVCEIQNVDVVADGGTVVGGVVCTC